MLKTKAIKAETITIPASMAKKLALKDGAIIEAKFEKGKLLILGKKNKAARFIKFAGIWANEDIDKVFDGIRGEWRKWQKNLPA